MRMNYKRLALIFFIFAIFLRVSLCLLNPPGNAFDDHLEPISLIIQHGTIPAKDACWECFQLPVFYVVSAMIGKLAIHIGANNAQVIKLLQSTCCVYGILTIFMIYLILNRFNLSDFSKLFAFGLICFLPRHIYMSAMLSNDTITYLFVAISIYILIIAIERKFSPISLIILSIIITITIFTKYSSFVIIPVMLTVFILGFRNLSAVDKKKKAIYFSLAIFIPLSILGADIFSNVNNYGMALPEPNGLIVNRIASQPRDEGGVGFLSFKPWESLKTPILAPGKLNSFWTIIYSGMWFDTEPKFLGFMDSNIAWWRQYYNWQNRGDNNFPGDNPSMSRFTILEGSGLIALGLFPLILGIIGGCHIIADLRNVCNKNKWIEATKMSIFPVLFISNAAGLIAFTLKMPRYSAMKASYLLSSMPTFAICLSIGLMSIENRNIFKRAIIIIFTAIFLLSFLHIMHISLCFLRHYGRGDLQFPTAY